MFQIYKNFITILLLGLLTVSCGIYSFTGSSIPAGVETFQVDYFENTAGGKPGSTIEPGLDRDFTIALQDLIVNQIAAKELYVAKYYISTQKWVPAINRLKLIISKYDRTIFVEEALHRLVEIHYHIGLENEAKKYAKILGYNYNSSEWFAQSYKVFNKDYRINKLAKKNEEVKSKENFFKRIIKIIK